MKIESKNLTNMCPEVTHVLTTIADTGAFDAGCWIAGGFARQVAHHELLQKKTSEQWGNYLKSYQSVPTPDTLRGDVDVFMLHQVTNDKFNDIVSALRNSVARFAKNMTAPRYQEDGRFGITMQVQFVTAPEFRYTGVRDCFENFDLHNARYAITQEAPGEFVLHWDPVGLEADKQRRVSIAQVTSPFLGARVMKYVQFRGCDLGLMSASNKILMSWLLRSATDSWPDHFTKSHISGIPYQMEKLLEVGFVETNSLALFINKWSTQVHMTYGEYVETDWALAQIEQRTK